MNSSMKEIANAIKLTFVCVYSTSKITTKLMRLGLEKWEVVDAVDFLKNKDHLIDSFFAYDDDVKLPWLKKKMRLDG